jgi:hypothetical protein
MLHADISFTMAGDAPKLARGYTRAGRYLFDSDDDTPVPALPVATIPAVQAPPDCISPPPRKRATVTEFPMANAVASAMKRESVLPKPPLAAPPPVRRGELDIRAYGTRTFSAAPAPKPAKGLWREFHSDRYRQGPPKRAYPRPPISTGQFNVVQDGAPWRTILVKEKAKEPWPKWGRGVVDLRGHGRVPLVAGRILRHAIAEASRIIRMTACEHKVGMCKCPHARFMFYQSNEADWQPWLLCLLASTNTREASFYLEASLIYEFEATSTNIDGNYNWLRSCDYGGEGPRCAEDANEVHYVYLAVMPSNNPSASRLLAAGLSEHEPIRLPRPYEFDPNVLFREPPEAPQ